MYFKDIFFKTINNGLLTVTDSDDVTVTQFQELHPQSKTQSEKECFCNRVTEKSGDAEKKESDFVEVEL
jgi:hypothetical protein